MHPVFERLFAVMCMLTCMAGAASAATAPDFRKLNVRVVDTYVLPSFAKLEKASGKLVSSLEDVCRSGAQSLEAAKRDFAATVLAWAAVEFLRFGPMSQIGRPERFFFWPDPRNVTLRQVNAVVAKRDATVLEPQTLIKKSAAVQGLSALELLLYDDKHPIAGNDEDARFRCQYAAAIAQTLHAETAAVIDEWKRPDGWRRRIVEPGPGDKPYTNAEGAAGDFARALLTGLQMIQDRQVIPMIEGMGNPARPVRLPFARSGLSDRYIGAGVASAQGLYDAIGLGRNIPRAKAWMPQWITQAFGRLSRDAPAAVKELGNAKTNPDRERQLRMVRFHVQNIRMLVGREIAPLAGLAIGFNELDGD